MARGGFVSGLLLYSISWKERVEFGCNTIHSREHDTMWHGDFDFSNRAVGAEERLADLMALYAGVVLASEGFLRKVEIYHGMIEEELDDHPEAAEYMAQSRRAVTLAEAWLRNCRTSVKLAPEFEPVDMKTLLEGVARRCRRILDGPRECRLDLPDQEIVVEGSLFQLQELFMRLMLWAADPEVWNTPEGAPLCAVLAGTAVHLDNTDLRRLGSRIEPSRYFVLTAGAGDNVGFRPERLISFWEWLLEQGTESPFFHLEFLQTYGTAILHGGELFVESGTNSPMLTVVLPMVDDRKQMQAAHNIPEADLLGTETILLVDDEDTIWDVIIDMLRELGYSVILAANGREAVEIYRENPGAIDLVILDMLMPELDGAGAFAAIREADPNAKVLLSSGYISEEDVREVLEAGAVGFLQKPYRMVDLAHKLRAIFNSGKSA